MIMSLKKSLAGNYTYALFWFFLQLAAFDALSFDLKKEHYMDIRQHSVIM